MVEVVFKKTLCFVLSFVFVCTPCCIFLLPNVAYYTCLTVLGQPMTVKMITPISARIKEVPEKIPASAKVSDGQPLV